MIYILAGWSAGCGRERKGVSDGVNDGVSE